MSKVKEVFIFTMVILLAASVPVAVYNGLSNARGAKHQVTCGVVTPEGIQPTFNATEAKNLSVSEFGVIRTKDFVYTPASGEVCIFTKIGD